jgi:hypothetical protein
MVMVFLREHEKAALRRPVLADLVFLRLAS